MTVGDRLTPSRTGEEGTKAIVTTPSEVTYEAAEKSLADQRQSLADLRGRAATLLSAAAIVASFLGAQALTGQTASRNTPTPVTTTTSATTTTPETTTAISRGTTTEINEGGAVERSHGGETATTHGRSTATTRAISTTASAAPASTAIHLNAPEWIAVAAFVGLAIVSVVILLPRRWQWHTSAYVLVNGYVDPDVKVEDMQKDLAIYDEDVFIANQRKLDRLYAWFALGGVLLVVQVMSWIFDLARR